MYVQMSFKKISSVILNVILTVPAKINFAAVRYYAYVTCIFHQYITELVNCSFTETFFHSLVRLTSHRVVFVKRNDHYAIWQFSVPSIRCGSCNRFLQQPRRDFASWQFFTPQNTFWLLQFVHNAKLRVVAVSRLPQRVLAVLLLIERFCT
jgi:hypothetical protein